MLRLALAFALCLGFSAADAQTVEKAVPQSPAETRLSFAPVVKKVRPAVVNVYASRVETMTRNPLFDDPIFRQFFGQQGQESRVAQSLGSGVIVDPSGLVVTNHHVIEGMTDVKVALSDRREFPAKIVLRDPRTDLAVLQIQSDERFPVLEIGDSDAIEVGDFVLAIGNPFGVGQTVTQGIVSALARTQIGVNDYGFFIQTDAAINPGNSGGALVDLDGRLVGINSAIFSRSGGSVGIGFAIPVNMVKSVIAAAKHGGAHGQAAVARRRAAKRLQGHRRFDRPGAARRRAGGQYRRSRPGGGGGPKARRRHHRDRRPGRRRRRGRRLPARRQALGGRRGADGSARRQVARPAAETRRGAGNATARGDAHQEPIAVPGRARHERLARGRSRNCRSRASAKASSWPTSPKGR